MQPYCRANIVRGWVAEECGRVLSTAGVCDREPLHAPADVVIVRTEPAPVSDRAQGDVR